MRQGKVRLHLPEQVELEFRRNRENKIADALKRLKEQRLNLQFPQLCKDYDIYSRLRELQRLYEQAHSELLGMLTQDIADENLKADAIIRELFDLAVVTSTTQQILKRAQLRHEVGNPPGKSGSLGDAINWETLLGVIPPLQSICFVTDDRDYCSSLDENQFDPFLLNEWKKSKRSELFFYNKLSSFFKAKFPEIKLASEYEKESLIRYLANSGTFAETHSVIARLRQYADFTHGQVNDIVWASITNAQVHRIISAPDVKEFLLSVVWGREDQIEPVSLERLKALFAEHKVDIATTSGWEEVEPADIPF